MEAKEEAPPNPRFQIPTQMTVISCEEAADLNMVKYFLFSPYFREKIPENLEKVSDLYPPLFQ